MLISFSSHFKIKDKIVESDSFVFTTINHVGTLERECSYYYDKTVVLK